MGAATFPCRGPLCLLFGFFLLVHSSFIDIGVCFFTYSLIFHPEREEFYSFLLMSFVEEFFNRLPPLYDGFIPPCFAGVLFSLMNILTTYPKNVNQHPAQGTQNCYCPTPSFFTETVILLIRSLPPGTLNS